MVRAQSPPRQLPHVRELCRDGDLQMAKRPSNKERVQRKALEAQLTAKDKAEKKVKKKTTKKTTASRKKVVAASGDRMKYVWKVFNTKLKEVAAFPYAQRDKADAKAAHLSKLHGQEHEVRGVKVPLNQVI